MNKEKLTVETDESGKITYRNTSGKLHNPNGPAIVHTDGSKEHYIKGQRQTEAKFKTWQANANSEIIMNKETLTVETDENGTIMYFNADGDSHNPNGPAIIYPDGDKRYYINGQLHNPAGPAVVGADGHKSHWIRGKLHNPNGPAVVFADGDRAYYIKGEELTEAEFKVWQVEQTAPLHNKTATIDGVEYTLTAK